MAVGLSAAWKRSLMYTAHLCVSFTVCSFVFLLVVMFTKQISGVKFCAQLLVAFPAFEFLFKVVCCLEASLKTYAPVLCILYSCIFFITCNMYKYRLQSEYLF
jgi:hypothetical protein